MWVLFFMAVVFVALAIVVFVVKPWNDEIAMFGMSLSALALFVLLLTMPVYRADVHNRLAQRDALQQSYSELRTNPLEMVTVGKEIAEWNAWLASAKYWNDTQWRWWWPDDVQQTKPIR